MNIVIEQKKDQEIAFLIHKLMKANNTNLSKICRENDLDYTKTYRKIHGDIVTLDFLEEIVEIIGDGAQFKSLIFLSLEDKTGEAIERTTIKRNGGVKLSDHINIEDFN